MLKTFLFCLSISEFSSLFCVPVGIMCSTIGIKICTITAGIKMYKSIMTKRRNKHDKLALLGKSKLDIIEILVSKALIDSYINHDELFQ